MKLNKGENKDVAHDNQIEGTYREASNLVLSKKGDYLMSDLGNTKLFGFNTTEYLIGVIPTNISFVIFTEDVIGMTNNIYHYKDGILNTIIKTKEFNFLRLAPIKGEYKYNRDDELIVLFYSDFDVPRIINIDNIGIELDDNYEFRDSSDAIHTYQFSNYRQPNIILNSINNTGGDLLSGVYYISIQYKIIDNTYTNFSLTSNPIFIYKFSSKDNWYNIYANKSLEATSKSIILSIDNLDTRYKQYRLAVIYKSIDSTKVYVTSDYNLYNQVSINSINNLLELNLSTVLIRNLIFDRVYTSTTINNQLYLANVKIEEDIKYQKYACNIKSEYVTDFKVELDKYKNSYKDELILFDKKGFMPFEVYAFYIRFIKKTGEPTQSFHLPGKEIWHNADIPTTRDVDREIYSNAREWHMMDYSGAAIGSSVKDMGLWENETEFYPVSNEYDGSTDYDGNEIIGGLNLSNGNTKVRHHRFPSIRALNNISDVFGKVDSSNTSKIVRFAEPNNDTSPSSIPNSFNYNYNDDGTGYFEDSRTFVNNTNNDFNGTLDFVFHINSAFSPLTKFAYIKIWKLNEDNTLMYEYYSNSAANSLNVSEFKLPIILEKNKKLRIEIYVTNYYGTIIEDYYYNRVDDFLLFSISSYVTSFNRSSKILGIKFTNIFIPQYIKDSCIGYEILYAERITSNMSVIGYGYLNHDDDPTVDPVDVNKLRLYSFDLLNNKPSLNISYIREEFAIDKEVFDQAANVYSDNVNLDYEIAPIIKSKYILNDIDYTDPPNSKLDEHISIETNSNYPRKVVGHIMKDGTANDLFKQKCISIIEFNSNLYSSFVNQKLIRTGKIHYIDSIGTIVSPDIYGGDTISNLHGFINYTGWNNKTQYVRNHLLPEFSISNIGYRYTDDNIINIFYPKYNLVTGNEGTGNTYTGFVNIDEGSIFYDIANLPDVSEDIAIYDIPEYYGYESILNSINSLESSIIFNINNIYINLFPIRIHRSTIQGTESTIEAWRVFKPNEYIDSANNKGDIIVLDTDSKVLLIEHRYALLVLRAIDELKFNNGVIAALGDADIFDTKPVEIIPTDDGYVGCQSMLGSIRCKFGNTIIDRERGKIFIYNDGKIDEITQYGLTEWFENNTNYDLTLLDGEVYNFDDDANIEFDDSTNVEVEEASTQTISYNKVDNPYLGLGLFISYDENFERLIISKQNDYVDRASSWTKCYYPKFKQWGAFISNTPNMMFNNRNGVYTIENIPVNSDDRGIYKALHDEDNPCKFLSTNDESYIDVCFNLPNGKEKKYLSFGWNTVVSKNNIIYYNETFGNAIVYNYNRHSNGIKLVLQGYGTGNVRNTGGEWKFNDFRDVLANKALDIIDPTAIKQLLQESLGGGDVNTNWYDDGMFIDTFVVIRLRFDNNNGKSIQINDINAKTLISNRI